MLLALALSFAASAAEVHPVDGPWSSGAYVTVAGAEVVHAAWLDGGTLRYARRDDGAWSAPETIAEEVEAGDGGQIRPELVLTARGPAVGFVRGHRPHLATRGDEGWTDRSLSSAEVGMGALMDVAVVDGAPVVAWLDTRRAPDRYTSDVYAWTGAAEEPVYVDGADGVCMCCRPAVGEVDGRPAVAFRDADGEGREVRLLVRGDAGWSDRGHVTGGGWAPGGCPADGPSFAAGEVVVSDARDGVRKLWRGDTLLRATEGEAMQPRAVGEHLVWIAASPGSVRLMLDDRVLTERSGRLELLDPVRVGAELWIPIQGEAAQVLAVPAG